MRASKFINNIDLNNKNKEYNLVKVFIELNKSDISDLSDLKELFDRLISTDIVIVLVY